MAYELTTSPLRTLAYVKYNAEKYDEDEVYQRRRFEEHVPSKVERRKKPQYQKMMYGDLTEEEYVRLQQSYPEYLNNFRNWSYE